MIGALGDNLRYAVRGLRRRLILSATAVLTLALGIGVNATMFGVVNRLLLRQPDHVHDPERVVRFYTSSGPSASSEGWTTSLGDYGGFTAMREHGKSFERVAAYVSRQVTLGRGAEARQVSATLASASFFPLLGVQPALGRFFAEDEDRNGATPVAVLSDAFWHARFAGDASVIGQTILLHGSHYTVVGVTPPGFTGAELSVSDVWLPIHVAAPASSHPPFPRGEPRASIRPPHCERSNRPSLE